MLILLMNCLVINWMNLFTWRILYLICATEQLPWFFYFLFFNVYKSLLYLILGFSTFFTVFSPWLCFQIFNWKTTKNRDLRMELNKDYFPAIWVDLCYSPVWWILMSLNYKTQILQPAFVLECMGNVLWYTILGTLQIWKTKR